MSALGSSVRVLVVEDESEIRQFLVDQFQSHGHEARGVGDANSLMQEVNAFKPSLVLMDQKMPGKSGQEAIQEIRSHAQFAGLPIMVVSALEGENEKVNALTLGADDYITKPFSIRELMARSSALLRRSDQGQKKADEGPMAYRELSLCPTSYKVNLRGVAIELTLTEFKILAELLKQSGQVLTRDRLREHALGNLNVSDRTIDVHMAALRRKLNDYGDLIETVRGVGYRMS